MLKLTAEFVIITRTRMELVMIQTSMEMVLPSVTHTAILAAYIGATKVGAVITTQTNSTPWICVVHAVVVNRKTMTMTITMMVAMMVAMMAVMMAAMMELLQNQSLSYCKLHQMQKQLPLL